MVNSSLKQAGQAFVGAVKARNEAFSEGHNEIKKAVVEYKDNTKEYISTKAENFVEQVNRNQDNQSVFHAEFRKEVEDLTTNLRNGDSEVWQKSFEQTSRMIKYKFSDFVDYLENASADARDEVQRTADDFGNYEEFLQEFNEVLYPGTA